MLSGIAPTSVPRGMLFGITRTASRDHRGDTRAGRCGLALASGRTSTPEATRILFPP